MTLGGRTITSPDELSALWTEIDCLAEACGRPLSSTAWLLGWWRHRRPPGALLRVMTVREADELVGLAPFFAHGARPRYRLVGARTFLRCGPMARPGLEDRAARVFADALAAGHPRPAAVQFEGVDASSAWPARIAEAWPGGAPHLARDIAATQAAPTLSLRGLSWEAWTAGKSRNFRTQLVKRRRRAERQGAAVRLARTPDEVGEGIEALFSLHHRRWAPRGGSGALDTPTEGMLRDLVAGAGAESLRLYTLEIDGRPVAAHLCAATGGEVTQVQMGFDPSVGRLSPGSLLVLAAIEDGFSRGDTRIDFGPGAEPYKLRVADRDEPLGWFSLIPPGAGAMRSRLHMEATHAASRGRRVARRLPPRVRRRLRSYLPAAR